MATLDTEGAGDQAKFFFIKNKEGVVGFPYLVFSSENQIHLPLTLYVKFIAERMAENSIRSYLGAVTRYFSWLSQTSVASWDVPSDEVRHQISNYLLYGLKCQLSEHYAGFMMVRLTCTTKSTISIFLSAIRLFYSAMHIEQRYSYENPLVNFHIRMSPVDVNFSVPADAPRMPEISGVAQPFHSRTRLTDAYFVVVNETWVPQVIDDDHFPSLIFDAGKKIGWGAREILVTRMLFETGARVSEICGLTLADWYCRGLNQEAAAFSKGSRSRRIKFIRWSNTTLKLLLQYFDHVRILNDPLHLNLSAYLKRGKSDPMLLNVPLFLTSQATSLTAATFRDLYWSPACSKAEINADIHQIRHWYVTMAIKEIHATETSTVLIKKRTDELIKYMAWKSGERTLQAYQHYLIGHAHSEIQVLLHERLDEYINKPHSVMDNINEVKPLEEDEELAYLYSLGGEEK